jgi:hypothetical protein
MKPYRWQSLLALGLFSLSCGNPQAPTPQAGPQPVEPKTVVKPALVVPPTTDIAGELLLTASVGSIDSLLQRLASYVVPHLPPAVRALAQPDTLKAQLLKAIHAPELERSVDFSRPAVLGLVDPKLYHGGDIGPLLIALPIKDGQGLLDLLSKNTERHETTPWKDHIFTAGSGAIRVRFDKAWALVAGQEKTLNGAAGALLPLTSKAPATGAQLEVRWAAIYDRYGKQIDRMLHKLERRGTEKELLGGMLGMVKRWAGYLKGIEGISATIDLQRAAIVSRLSFVARPSGEFSAYLTKLETGAPWGAGFIPKESVLTIITRDGEAARLRDIEDGLKVLKGLLAKALTATHEPLKKDLEARLEAWRLQLQQATRAFSGESAVGAWINGDGGVGFGGAVKVKEAKVARAQMIKTMKMLAKDLAQIQAKLPAVAKKELRGFSLALQVRPAGLKAGKESADLFELAFRWPKLKQKEDQRKLEELKKSLGKVLGPKVALAFGAVGETGLVSFGKDHRKRMADLVAAAMGGKASGLEKIAIAIVGGKKMVTFLHVPVATLIEGGLRVADQITTVPSDVKDTITKMLPGAGKDAPVSAVLHLDGSALVWESSISADLLSMMAKAVMAAFTPRQTP